jgi:hypothetical protein
VRPFGRLEARGREQAAPGSSSPPCEAPSNLHDGGKATTEEISGGSARFGLELGGAEAQPARGFMGSAHRWQQPLIKAECGVLACRPRLGGGAGVRSRDSRVQLRHGGRSG